MSARAEAVEVSSIEHVRRSGEQRPPSSENRSAPGSLARVDAGSFPKFDDMTVAQISGLLIALGCSLFLFAIEQTIVATSISTIGTELHMKDSLTWITTSYLLTCTAFLPLTGRIADSVNVRTFLLLEVWIFVVGNIIAGTAHGFGQFVAGRLIAGIGGSGLINLVCIIISQMTTERQRGAYFNLINCVFIISDSLGPIVGGALAHVGQWRWIFLFTAPFAPVITAFIFLTFHPPKPLVRMHSVREAFASLDIMGMFLVVACLSMLVVGLNMGGQDLAWDDPVILGCLVGSGVAFVLFVVAEKRARMPVMPVELFSTWKWRNVAIMMLLRTLNFFHLYVVIFYLPVLLQVLGQSTITASALVIPFLIISAIISTAASFVLNKCKTAWQIRMLFIIPMAILVVGLSLLATLNKHSSIGQIVGYLLIVGLGYGPSTQTTLVVATLGLPADYLSTTTALIGAAPSLGGTLGVAALGTAINNFYRSALPSEPWTANLNPNSVVETLSALAFGSTEYEIVVDAYVHAWQLGLWILVGVAGFQLLVCLILKPVTFDEVSVKAEGMKEGVDGQEKDRVVVNV